MKVFGGFNRLPDHLMRSSVRSPTRIERCRDTFSALNRCLGASEMHALWSQTTGVGTNYKEPTGAPHSAVLHHVVTKPDN